MRQASIAAFTLIVAGWGLGWPIAASAQPASAPASYSQRQIHDYASALFKVLTVKRMAEAQVKTAAPAERQLIEQQAQAAIDTILARHGLNDDSFNRLSAAIERQPALRRQVRQLVMEERLGY